jgi:polysaccharide export outer membrane protein
VFVNCNPGKAPPSKHGRKVIVLMLFVTAGGLAGCASGRGGPIPYATQELQAPDVETVAPPSSQQRIGPLDRIRVTVFQVQDLSGEFTVDAAGKIDYPLIGAVTAQGLTPPELSQQIAAQLSRRYLRQPSVQVSFLEQQQQTITIDGAVRQAGIFPIRGQTTLLRAVAMGRGTSEDANAHRVVVFRTIQGRRAAAAFDLTTIRRGEAEDPVIYGNDVVVVDSSRSRAFLRDVLSVLPLVGIFTFL